jgi:hypothetical protein
LPIDRLTACMCAILLINTGVPGKRCSAFGAMPRLYVIGKLVCVCEVIGQSLVIERR